MRCGTYDRPRKLAGRWTSGRLRLPGCTREHETWIIAPGYDFIHLAAVDLQLLVIEANGAEVAGRPDGETYEDVS